MKNLEKNLHSKHRLEFGDGKFKIVMVTDLQDVIEYDPRTLRALCGMLDDERPDLVILGGDNCNGKILRGRENLRRYLDLIAEPMESRRIPWAHVYGNHDHDIADVPAEVQQRLYEAHEYCVSKHTDAGVGGKSNFVLPVFGGDGSLKFCVWGLDSNNRWKNYLRDVGLPEDLPARLPVMPEQYSRWDIIRFDQLMWYYKSSEELEKFAGRRVDGMLFTHVAPHEMAIIKNNPAECGYFGNFGENLNLGGLNSGVFATLLERGDIKTVACGHLHFNDVEGEFYGIKICLSTAAGFYPPGDDDTRGYRVFELTETETGATLATRMVRASNYL